MKRIMFLLSIILMLGVCVNANAYTDGGSIGGVTVSLNDDGFSNNFSTSANSYVYGLAGSYPFLRLSFGPNNSISEISTDNDGIQSLYDSSGGQGYYDIWLLVRENGQSKQCYFRVYFR